MTKSISKSLVAITLISLTTFSCKKKDDPAPTTNSTYNNNGNTISGSFQWQENNGSINTADSAYWTTGSWGTGIRAYKGGMNNYFEINWLTANNTSVGTKTLDPTYGITYLKGSSSYSGSNGQSLSITAFANNQLSGNFQTPVTTGTITALTGTFSSLSKK